MDGTELVVVMVCSILPCSILCYILFSVILPSDSVSITVTEDTFTTLNPHQSQIATGNEMHVNNPNCIKINQSHWNMVYTVLPLNSNLNKPGYSTATTGMNLCTLTDSISCELCIYKQALTGLQILVMKII